MVTETEIIVELKDIDELGHVNNTIYGFYLERARTDWYARAGLSFDEMEELGIGTVVVRLDISYLVEARLGDILIVQTIPERKGNKSFVLKQVIYNQNELKVSEAFVTSVMIDRSMGKSIPLHKEITKNFP